MRKNSPESETANSTLAIGPHLGAEEPPVVIGPIRAYRSWYMRWHAGVPTLQSLYRSTVWPYEGPLQAGCERHCTWVSRAWRSLRGRTAAHACPRSPCGCGIYAVTRLDLEGDPAVYLAEGIQVAGSVLLWGRVIQHTSGYRAEYARPLRLLAMPKLSPNKRVLLDRVAEQYGVSVVDHARELLP